MLLAMADRRIGVAEKLSFVFPDRDATRIVHSLADMIRARMFAIACGYEDSNDLDHLRADHRRRWPDTHITFRGDGHYARPEAMTWCEQNGIDYIFGLSGTQPLARQVDEVADAIRTDRAADNKAVVRGYTETRHAAGSWDRERRVLARIEVTELGLDTRYVVTGLGSCPSSICLGHIGIARDIGRWALIKESMNEAKLERVAATDVTDAGIRPICGGQIRIAGGVTTAGVDSTPSGFPAGLIAFLLRAQSTVPASPSGSEDVFPFAFLLSHDDRRLLLTKGKCQWIPH